jgi:hypothetical protein
MIKLSTTLEIFSVMQSELQKDGYYNETTK